MTDSVQTPSPDQEPNLNKNFAVLFGVLFGISELLALIPSIKANSIFELVFNALKSITGQ